MKVKSGKRYLVLRQTNIADQIIENLIRDLIGFFKEVQTLKAY